MRGMGAFQMAQMKHRDARVHAMFAHIKSALEIMEQIASDPFQPPQKELEVAPSPPAPPPKPFEPPPEKLAYTIKELAGALGISRSTIYAALSDGKLEAVKLGNRTLIMADVLREWVRAMPKR